jgi:hypothetical protein
MWTGVFTGSPLKMEIVSLPEPSTPEPVDKTPRIDSGV